MADLTVYNLKDLDGRDHVVTDVLCRDGLSFATIVDNGDVPIYSIKYNREFQRFHDDKIEGRDDIRNCGQGGDQGHPRRPH